jgi:putative oxidoreductase
MKLCYGISRENIYTSFRCLLGLVFLGAGIIKCANVYLFALTIIRYGLFPQEFTPIIAIIIPFLEVVLGGFLLFNIYPLASSIFSSILSMIFTGIISVLLLKGSRVECGCFGFLDDSSVSPITLLRVVIMLFISILLVRFIYRQNIYHTRLNMKKLLILFILMSLGGGYAYNQSFDNDIISVMMHFDSYYLLTAKTGRIKSGDDTYYSSPEVELVSKSFIPNYSRMEPIQRGSDFDGKFALKYRLFIVFSIHDCYKCLEELGFWNKLNINSYYKSSLSTIAIARSGNTNQLTSYFKANHYVMSLFRDTTKGYFNVGPEEITPIKILTDKNGEVIRSTKLLNGESEITSFKATIDSCLKTLNK